MNMINEYPSSEGNLNTNHNEIIFIYFITFFFKTIVQINKI